ncbi:MAG: DUF4168 domain-containing protein [Candidatus Binatia bacterium]
MGKNAVWSFAFATLAGVCTLLPSTVTSAPEPPQQHRDTQTHVSDQELEAFAKAYVEHDTIRQTYEPLHKNAPDAEERKRIEQEANAKAEEALAKQGLTPETYKQIFSTVNANDELRKKALKLIDEERKRP